MRRLLITVLVIGAAVSAASAEVGYKWFKPPPAAFDQPYAGNLKIIEVPRQHLQAICAHWPAPAGDGFSACAYFPDATQCTIYIRDDPIAYEARAELIRHETGHCNGWPANHPMG